jgi:3-hydroxybutyrate dehydrogenase
MPEGRVAVVTGSTSGIGLGIAEALACEGMDIVLNGFGDAYEIEALRERLAEEAGVRVTYTGADMSKPAEVRGMITRATRELGHVDVLVNNAGIEHSAPVHEFPPEQWDAIIAVNLSAAFHATAAVLPQMLERNWGRIVNVACVHGLVGSRDKAAYVAARHGVIGLTKVVALETAATGVTCNAICPGWVLTPAVQRHVDELTQRERMPRDRARERMLGERQPSGEFATPAQIGALAAFICTDDAMQIRGAALPVDGAWLAQ